MFGMLIVSPLALTGVMTSPFIPGSSVQGEIAAGEIFEDGAGNVELLVLSLEAVFVQALGCNVTVAVSVAVAAAAATLVSFAQEP